MAIKMKNIFNSILQTFSSHKKIDFIFNRNFNDYKNVKVNLGQLQSVLNNQKARLKNLSEVEFQIFSQFGDDGIIQFLINKLSIKNKTFIEFGVENYRESNTRFLLINNYWSGFVIDGSQENINQIKNEQLYTFYDLRAKSSFINCENINSIMLASGFESEIGILSIDIDGNDYWVWKAINAVHADIVICEYNSLFGFEDAITIKYNADFVRGINTPFNFYGTSLKAIYLLAKEKGYFFIGCNSAGNNAYFIAERLRETCPIDEKTPEEGYVFAVFSETWDLAGEPSRGTEKIKSIEGLEVVDVKSMQVCKIDSTTIINSLVTANKLRGIK